MKLHSVYLFFFCTVFSLFSLSKQTNVKARIKSNSVLPSLNRLAVDTRVQLRSRDRTYLAPIQSNGIFEFVNVSDGTYALDVLSIEYEFAHFRVDVNGSMVTPYYLTKGHSWTQTSKNLSYPFSVRALSQHTYLFQPRRFSLFRLLKSPMMLFSLAAVGMLLILPHMKVDPALLEQAQQEMQKKRQ
ncbi:hypothetical protein SJAG_00277 [Schizosaccharomyces japonicus yFS275]|uniref:ER membrane protein complex subunit 7 beta-sandwich domain-containing protein n=1 Tax=Schizosaccharomyces japonicus (strain yFS275 / FY16936) TaxID=402676 RepID=B6JV72_SCHJY|nr:hypothetical protein SJAG_00277 [Schizosaccharomyces japonicus yFS275]EEB05273.1 hypothetical protein SJAG_00277 [Schizosaccharomyces japonicus yFS275]